MTKAPLRVQRNLRNEAEAMDAIRKIQNYFWPDEPIIEAEPVEDVSAADTDPAPESDFWTPERDLKLVREQKRLGIGRAARNLGVTSFAASRRYHMLLPSKGEGEREGLVRRLEREVLECQRV